MTIELFPSVIILLAIILLLVFVVKKNQNDEKKFEEKLNQDFKKHVRADPGDINDVRN